jgi:iron complex outermembrane recepter protein
MKIHAQARKHALFVTVGVLLLAKSVFAQPIEEVTVTGSRIVQDGYQAPTPVTVVGAADLALSTPTTIHDGLRKLPELVGSSTPNTNPGFQPNNHGHILNLRGLGPNRSLIMLDGVRLPPNTFDNRTNVDVLPELLMSRVDIVTGGASASYGSDAVAGVVNYILDKNFVGIKGVAQYGTTEFGDAQNHRLGIGYGQDVLEHGHFLFSADYYKNDGYLEGDRPWLYDETTAVGAVVGGGVAGSAKNPMINNGGRPTAANYATVGGAITTGPFADTNFVSPGVYRPIFKGELTGSPGFYYQPSDYINQPDTASTQAANENYSLFGRYSHDINENTRAYVQLIGSRADSHSQGNPNIQFSPQLRVFSGNAFLPPPLQAMLTATNTAQVNYVKLFTDLGPIQGFEDVDNTVGMVGMDGKVGRFGWKVDYAYGHSISNVRHENVLALPHFYAALDSVVNSSGQIVCYPTLNPDPVVAARYADCVPWNPFGFGAASAAANAYVTGISRFRTENTTGDITGSVAGDLGNLPAGPVSVAMGVTHRTASLAMTSNADPTHPPDVTGLRGVVANAAYYLTNQGTANGDVTVNEAFIEFGIPVIKDKGFARSLDLNTAVRYSDYSTTGSETPWKFGATWRVSDALMVRATRSHDTRAPTLYDLYAGKLLSLSGAALDPHTNTQVGFNTGGGGNPNLKPEIGDTITAGVSFTPRKLDGFSGSVDFYNIKITDAISTLSPLAILTSCEVSGGTGPSCANIVRPFPFDNHTPANAPSLVTTVGINATLVKMSGVDVDLSYRMHPGKGQLMLRAYLGYIDQFQTQVTSDQPIIDYAGWSGGGAGGVSSAIPQFKGTLSANYTIGNFGIFVQEDMINSLKLGPPLNNYTSGVYLNPDISGYYMTDLTFTWQPRSGKHMEVFTSVTNLFDARAPIVNPTIAAGNSLSTINGLYDTTGRAYMVGLRFSPK